MKCILQVSCFTKRISYKLTPVLLLSSLLPFGKGKLEKKIKGRDEERKKEAWTALNMKNLHHIEIEKFTLKHADSDT